MVLHTESLKSDAKAKGGTLMHVEAYALGMALD